MEFRKALGSVLDNPANESAAFNIAWSTAREAAGSRIRNLDAMAVVSVAKSEVPEQLVLRLARPDQVSNLKTLRRVIPSEDFATFQNAFKGRLLDNADTLTKTLNEFDKPTIDLLLSPADQTVFKQIGQRIDQLNRLGVSGAGAKQITNRSFIRELFDTNSTAAVSVLNGIISREGGKLSPVGRSVRAGIMDGAIERMFQRQGSGTLSGIRTLEQGAVDDVIGELIQSGQARLLIREDIGFLRGMSDLAPRLAKTADAGTSIQAAETAAGLRGLNPLAAKTLLEHLTIARIYLSETGKFILVGSGGKQTVGRSVRLIGAALNQSVVDLQQEKDLRELSNAT